MWIQIRMDPHLFSLLDPDPDPRGNIFQIITEKIGKNKFIQIFKVNLHKLHCFMFFFNKRKLFIRLFFTNLFKLNPDSHF